MKKSEGIIIFILLFAAIIVGAYLFYSSLSKTVEESETTSPGQTEAVASQEPEAGKTPAPDFTVYDADGNAVSLSDFVGKPVVLNFWASWCHYCKLEMPDFDEVYGETGDEVVFLMVNVTGGRETLEAAQSYLDENAYSFPVYFDTDLDATNAYNITGLPTTVFIDAEGYVTEGHSGMLDKETLIENIGLISGG